MSINQVVLSGRLGAAPEISNLKNGNRVANMRLATEKNWKKPDGSWGSKTAWHSITTFNEHLIKRLENYGKGDQVTVTGELDYDIYEDNNCPSSEVLGQPGCGFSGGLASSGLEI